MVLLNQIRAISSSSLVKNSLIYVITDGINKAIPFVLLPLISRYLTPSEYGIITNYNVLISILGALIYLCTGGVIPVMFYKLDKKDLKIYVSNMLLVNTAATLICLIIMLCSSSIIDEHLNIPLNFQLTAIVLVWFTSIGYANLVLWRCEEKAWTFGFYNICSSLLNAVLTVLLVVVLLMGWEGRALSIFFSAIIMGIVSLFILYKKGYLVFSVSKEYIKSVLVFSIPIIPHALSFWIKSGADKIMLTDMCGLAENGLYSVAVTWGAIVSMVMVAFSNSYSPWLYKKLAVFDKDKEGTINEQKKLVKTILFLLTGIFVAVLIIYVLSYILIGLMYPESYSGSKEYLPYVMLSQAFNGAYLLFVCFLHYTFKTKILGVTTFLLSLVQIALAYLFILKCGAIGVAYSSVIGSVLTFIIIAVYGIRYYKLPWKEVIKGK